MIKVSSRPKRIKGLQNNYLPPILIAAVLILSIGAKAQVLQGQRQKINAKGYDYKEVAIDSLLRPPRDTIQLKVSDSGAIVAKDSSIYVWTGYYWRKASGAGGGLEVTATDPIQKVSNDFQLRYNAGGLDVRPDGYLYNKTQRFKTADQLRSISFGDTGYVYSVKIGNSFYDFIYDPDDLTTNDDSIRCIRAGSLRFKNLFSTIYPEMFGAKGNGIVDDSKAFQRMFDWMAPKNYQTWKIGFKNSHYLINDSIVLPQTINPTLTHEFIYVDAYGVTFRTTGGAITMFRRIPQTTPSQQTMVSDYKLIWKGGTYVGNQTTGQKAFELSCFYGSVFEDMNIQAFDTAFVGNFWLQCVVRNGKWVSNKSVGFIGRSGADIWPGATLAGSAFNANLFEGCRWYNASGSYASLILMGADQTVVRSCVSEGFRPRYNFYMDYQGGTNGSVNTFENTWLECSSGTPNVNFYLRTTQITKFINTQRIYPDTLFKVVSPAPNSSFIWDGLPYMGNLPARPFDAEGQTLSGIHFKFSNVQAGNIDLLTDTTKWVAGIAPSNVEVNGLRSGNLGPVWRSNTLLSIQSRYNTTPASRYAEFRSGILRDIDNTYYDGGISTNFRAFRHIVGTGGYRVDGASTYGYGFGDATANPTEYINRPSAGILRMNASALDIPTAASDPANFEGRFYYNTTSKVFKFFNGTTWVSIGAGGGGGSYSFVSGLSEASGTVTNDLITGKAGGQTIIGGTASGNNLTFQSNPSNDGKLVFGSTSAFDQSVNRLGIGTTSPTHDLTLGNNKILSIYTAGIGTADYQRLTIDGTSTTIRYTAQSGGSASAPLHSFLVNASTKFAIDQNNNTTYSSILPGTDNALDLGRTAGPLRFRNLYAMKLSLGGTTTPLVGLQVETSDAVLIAKGTTAQRPVGVQGYIRANSDSVGLLESYVGSTWRIYATRNWVRDSVETLFSKTLYEPNFTFSGTNRKGDIMVRGASGWTMLPIGAIGQVPVVQSDSTLAYEDVGAGGGSDDWGDQVVEHDSTLINLGTSASKLGVNPSKVLLKQEYDSTEDANQFNISLTDFEGGSGPSDPLRVKGEYFHEITTQNYTVDPANGRIQNLIYSYSGTPGTIILPTGIDADKVKVNFVNTNAGSVTWSVSIYSASSTSTATQASGSVQLMYVHSLTKWWKVGN